MPSLTILGAAGTVTGSRFLLDSGRARILIDCGQYQERNMQAHNWDPFAPPAREITAVALTHAHIDHCGLLPRLAKQGFQGPVYCTKATADIVPIILQDAAHLQAEDVATKTKRHYRENRQSPRPLEPLFDLADVDRACRELQPLEWHRPVQIAEGVRAEFRNAGHILGSASILFEIEADGASRRLLVSGDLGRRDRPLIPDPDDPPDCDVAVIESTYGDRLHEETQDVETAIGETIRSTAARGGAVLVPCFAVERAQDLLWYLRRLVEARRIPSLPVFLDSPMAERILAVFGRHPEACDPGVGPGDLDFPGLRLVHSGEESKTINEHRGPMVVIAGSGMCTGGRIKHHLAHRIGDTRNTVCFVGYQANATLGRQIVDGARFVRIFGQEHRVAAQVVQIRGFSGHADRDELLDWLGRLRRPPRQVLVVHGGTQVSAGFAALINERLGWTSHAPALGETIVF